MELLEIALLWFWYLFAVCGVCFFTACLILRGFGDYVVLVVLRGAEFAGGFAWFGGFCGVCLGLATLGFGWWGFGLLLFDVVLVVWFGS